jgi:hypothetical protein
MECCQSGSLRLGTTDTALSCVHPARTVLVMYIECAGKLQVCQNADNLDLELQQSMQSRDQYSPVPLKSYRC